MLPKECFGLLASKLNCSEPYFTKKKAFLPFCLKYAACSFIAGKHVLVCVRQNWDVFSVIAPKKRLSSSLQRVTLILLDFTQNNVFVCFLLW